MERADCVLLEIDLGIKPTKANYNRCGVRNDPKRDVSETERLTTYTSIILSLEQRCKLGHVIGRSQFSHWPLISPTARARLKVGHHDWQIRATKTSSKYKQIMNQFILFFWGGGGGDR